MSFSVSDKNQISQLISHNRCCQMAEFLALTKTDGVISINSSVGVTLKIVTKMWLWQKDLQTDERTFLIVPVK